MKFIETENEKNMKPEFNSSKPYTLRNPHLAFKVYDIDSKYIYGRIGETLVKWNLNGTIIDHSSGFDLVNKPEVKILSGKPQEIKEVDFFGVKLLVPVDVIKLFVVDNKVYGKVATSDGNINYIVVFNITSSEGNLDKAVMNF